MDFILGFGAVIAVGLIYHYRSRIKRSWNSLADEFKDSMRD